MNPLIEICDLRKRFRRNEVLRGVHLSVPEGRITAFLGPNGAGKTTTIKCALGLLPRDGGQVRVLGADARHLGPEQWRTIGYVSENQSLPLWMTVDQLLDYCRPMYPTWDKGFEQQLRRQFDLPGATRLRDLSRGQRMKASLLSSLAYRPQLVVLDEPFSGLDPLVRDEFLTGLLELTEREGWTVWVSSHDIEEVERLADQVSILAHGRIDLSEEVSELQERFRWVEVLLPQEASPDGRLPDAWLHAQVRGRMVGFVDSRYREGKSEGEVRRVFPGALQTEVRPMTLREIFVALARTYRLHTDENPNTRDAA